MSEQSQGSAVPNISFDLTGLSPASAVYVPEHVARHLTAVPLFVSDGVLQVAAVRPDDRALLDDLRVVSGLRVAVRRASPEQIAVALDTVYPPRKAVVQTASFGESDAVSALGECLAAAIAAGASDIHVEPLRSSQTVRFRIDGILYRANGCEKIFSVPHEETVARLKVLCGLDTVERRRPQDGRAEYRDGDGRYDLRVSVVPSVFGESAVIRILPGTSVRPLGDLGFYPAHSALIESLLTVPHGIVFVSGPTGSGKTTTMYACLQVLDRETRKVITLEDPVEYELAGVTQIPVQAQLGFTFASALRSVLRHDPDVLMVGEIRDSETAELALRSAMTGHLLLTTVHANDAASIPLRLLDLGAEPFLVAASARAFIAQRLIRVLCPHCRVPRRTPVPAAFEGHAPWESVGCPRCGGSGYRGRTVIYEIILNDDKVSAIVRGGADAGVLAAASRENGSVLFADVARQKVADGVTTPEEIMRVMR